MSLVFEGLLGVTNSGKSPFLDKRLGGLGNDSRTVISRGGGGNQGHATTNAMPKEDVMAQAQGSDNGWKIDLRFLINKVCLRRAGSTG